MKFNLAAYLLDHRGQPIRESEDKSATLGSVLEQTLIAGGKPDSKPDMKVRQFKLAQRVTLADEQGILELDASEVEFIKELAAPLYAAVAYGSLCAALDNPVTEIGR